MASMKRYFHTSFFLLISLISSCQTSPLSSYLVNSFTSNHNTTFNHFTVSANGSLYIGAVDNLYHLSRNFTLQSQVEFRNEGERNVNKVLAIIPFPVNKLISCGSGLNGTCQFRNLDNISQDVTYLSQMRLRVAPKNNSTVGLVVEEGNERISLYIAQTVRVDVLLKKPVSSIICLYRGDQSRCKDDGGNDGNTKSLGNVRPEFRIHYVAVFSYQGYTYYVASQRKDATQDDSPIVPKMSRVCHDDKTDGLSGFTEITLECNGTDGSFYSIAKSAVKVNETLYIAFVKNNPEFGPDIKGTNQSALCVYEMENLIAEFEESIVNCSCNSPTRGNNNYLQNSICIQTVVACDLLKGRTCYPPRTVRSMYPERSSTLDAVAGLLIFEWKRASFSAVATTAINQPIDKNIVFIGTREGTLLKMHFDADLRNNGILYETLDMDNPVLSDTWIDPKEDTAIFLTEKQLLEIALANCSQYKTCDECIKPDSKGGDPYCGWCTLEKRCTRYEQCQNSSIPSRWLWYNETKCSGITAVTPSTLSVDVHSRMVAATILRLPMPDDFNYVCHFGSFFTSVATLNNDGMISCLSPGEEDIPTIPEGDDAIDVGFAVSSTEFNISFVSISYSFFNCSRIERCVDCVSKWSCDWCIDELLCTYNIDSVCNNITSITDDAEDFCPFLLSGKTVVPSGVNRQIKVTAKNLNLTPRLLEREYECFIQAEENIQMIFLSDANVTRGSNDAYNVTCGNRKYNYSLEEQEVQTVLSLRWKNTDVFLDGNFNVTLYKCHIDRPDCSRCLSNITTRPELECGWCNNPQGFCTVEESCSSGLLRECIDPPKINMVSPISSPIEGGTIVEINGTDLGQRFSDIVNVSLAGVLCHHQSYADNYEVGASLTCETGNSSNTREGKVSLFVVNKAEAEYEVDQFSYNDPQISSVHPILGPQSGGTLITISGTDLQTGRDIRVQIGENNCNIVEHISSKIVCQNRRSAGNESSSQNQTVSVNFDGNERLAKETFSYHKDPEVSDLMPKKAIRSGGNFLTVTGEMFNVIQKPRIRFTIDGNSAEEDCSFQDQNGMEIICQSPNVAELLKQRQRRADSPEEGTVDVGFIMDGVTDLLNWSQNKSVVFQYFRDPSYDTFGVLNLPRTTNNLLTLNGKDLNLASTDKDVTVFIGTQNCIVKSLEATILICQLPSEPLTTGNLYGNLTSRDLPFVIVRHANLEFNIGYINFSDEIPFIVYVIIGLCALVMLIVLIVGVSLCYIRRKKTERIRDLELQVRNIHDSVSANLKTLFATLQTTLHDFETIIGEQTEIPLLKKRQYLLNMMFLGQSLKPSSSLPEGTVENAKISVAMEKFSEVLYRKRFLKVLIQTLDNTSSISAMDRANAGSLLSVCLLQSGNMELYTDLLLSIMEEHIQDCDSKRKLRSLFRGNDTMLEKLISNWFTIFLYGFLKDQAASKVYQLYEAIKYVCEMGPIDAVSGKSQFSINDQEMLETQIDFSEVDIEVITDSKSGDKKPLKVLDVNTVTQVKERIISNTYRHIPYSQRPSPFTRDLMWRAGRSGQLILRDDENLPGSLEKQWKKICTLKDLKVPSGSIFELVRRQQNPNAQLYSNGKGGQTGSEDSLNAYTNKNYDNEVSDSDSDYETVQSQRRTYEVILGDGVKVWHLIKDDQEDFSAEENQNEPRPSREIREVVLPFLPATRNYIQTYVDNLMDTLFPANDRADVPLSIKYLFQFFDQQAGKDDKVGLAKAWKNNVLPLRYWSTIMANPQYVLDVGVYSYTHACLRILVQVIKDTCDARIKEYKNQDFSPSRILYTNFLKGYISKLDNYYLFIHNLGRVDSEDLKQESRKVEQEFQGIFDLTSTLQKLYSFVADNQRELMDALNEDEVCSELSFPTTLQTVADTMGDY